MTNDVTSQICLLMLDSKNNNNNNYNNDDNNSNNNFFENSFHKIIFITYSYNFCHKR